MTPFKKLCVLCLLCALCASCKKEDDIQALFEGKTWYITNGYIQGRQLAGDDIRSLCASPQAYQISFSTSSFVATLTDGNTFTGQWKADGKNQTFTLNIRQEPSKFNTLLEENIYHTLKKTIRYEGDINIMKFHTNDGSYIGCGSKRSPESFR
jgi:hypothetical protein